MFIVLGEDDGERDAGMGKGMWGGGGGGGTRKLVSD